jgi:hypothetical protein
MIAPAIGGGTAAAMEVGVTAAEAEDIQVFGAG